METLVFATHNLHKLAEVSAMLRGLYNVVGLKDIGCTTAIPETGHTLLQNALQKAEYVHTHYACNCFADDTGLEVNALHGAPGVYSARYAGEQCDAEANIDKLLQALQGVVDRSAQFRTVITLIQNDNVHYFEGKVTGEILTERHGTGGFGYDAVFRPDGFEESFAQLTIKAKNNISHRGRAVAALIDFLKKNMEK